MKKKESNKMQKGKRKGFLWGNRKKVTISFKKTHNETGREKAKTQG